MRTVATPHSRLEEIRRNFEADGDASKAIAARTELADELTVAAYHRTLGAASGPPVAVLAVGGFGRRDLYPHSDIDILVLVEREIQGNEQKAALSAFLRDLWDAGLRVSQSVRGIAECCELDSQNVELSISLLDQRFLCGAESVYAQLSERLAKFLIKKKNDLIGQLCGLARARHAKFHNTIYHLEPNIKETPGGMRDIQLTRWLAQLRASEQGPIPLERATQFLGGVRCRLHYRSGRDNNVLNFDAQEAFSDDAERWMREYYRNARDVHRAALREIEVSEGLIESSLIRQFQDWRGRLSNADFTVNRERVFFKSPQQLQADPDLAMRLFQFIARHGIGPSLEAQRRIAEHLPMLREHFAFSRATWPALRDILNAQHATVAVRSLHETGMLLAIFPEWSEIDSLVVRDFYHRYTVDEHTIVTLENLSELRASKDPARRRFQDLLSEIPEFSVLAMALLFHDVGKGAHTGNHSQVSVELARAAFQRIQMPADLAATALFLIEQHLVLSAAMTRDLNDRRVVVDAAHLVGTIERVRYLTLLTYADVSAVNPEAMTRWRLEQLWRVLAVVSRELTKELDSERIHIDTAGQEFLEGFPTRYLHTHSEADVRWHQELERLSRVAGVAVDLRKYQGAYQATIVTSDRPNLFASLAGTLSGFGMNIVKAEAFANQNGVILDTFTFEDPMRTLELNPQEVDRLKLTMQRAALGKEDVRRLLRGRVRTTASGKLRVEPSVVIDNDASNHATLVEILTEDRSGLLYDVAEAISSAGCSIDVVLIDTEAHKALDVFYITCGGQKVSESVLPALRARLLEVCSGLPTG